MNPIQLLEYIIAFTIFLCLQAMAINGAYESFKGSCTKMNTADGAGKIVCKGMIFYPVARFLDRVITNETLRKPLYECVKCMASVWGALTYWPLVVMIFGFHWQEVIVYVWDVFILVWLNSYFYKKL